MPSVARIPTWEVEEGIIINCGGIALVIINIIKCISLNFNRIITHYDQETIEYDGSSQHHKYEEATGVKVLSISEQPTVNVITSYTMVARVENRSLHC